MIVSDQAEVVKGRRIVETGIAIEEIRARGKQPSRPFPNQSLAARIPYIHYEHPVYPRVATLCLGDQDGLELFHN